MTHYLKHLSYIVLLIINCVAYAESFEEDLTLIYGGADFISIATGQQQLISKAPAVATVITADDIQAIGATDLDEVLETVPGLHVAFNETYTPIYTIRGIYSQFNPQVLVLINGVSISNLFLGNRGTFWGGMPVKMISRIEVIRGPGSAVYGADAFGGVINIITKSKKDISGIETGIRTGSFSTQDAWLLYGGTAGQFDIALSLEYHKTDGHDEIISSDLQTILDFTDGTNVSRAPGPVNLSRDNLDLRLDISKENWTLRAGLQQREDLGTGAGIAEALDPSGRFASNRRNLDLTYHNPELSDNWDLNAQLTYFEITQEIDNDLIIFPPGTQAGLGLGVFPDGAIGNPEVFERQWRFNASTFYKGFTNHSIRLGTGFHNSDIYRVQESKNFGLDANGNLILPGAPITDVTDSPFVFLPEGDRNSWYFFAQDIWKLASDWELTTGIRYDDYSDFGSTINPRLALVWNTKHNITTKFIYGQAFRAPAFAETRAINNPAALGNANLDPEEIESLEIAIDYRPQDNLRLGLNLFTYTWDNIIDFVPDPAPATTQTAQNFGEQTSNGLELEFDWGISSTLNLLGNFAYQNSTNEDTNTDAGNSPQQQMYLRLEWNASEAWKLSSQINSVIDRKRPAGDPRSQIDDYQIIDLNLRYQTYNKHWSFAISVRNAFDEDAREPDSFTIPNDLPLAGRNFYGEFSYNWGE